MGNYFDVLNPTKNGNDIVFDVYNPTKNGNDIVFEMKQHCDICIYNFVPCWMSLRLLGS